MTPPGNPKIWEAIEQRTGAIWSFRNQSLLVDWGESHPANFKDFNLNFYKRVIEIPGIFDLELKEKVEFPILQVRRVGKQSDPMISIMQDYLGFYCKQKKVSQPEIHFFREFEFSPKNWVRGQSLPNEIVDLFITALESLASLGSKSGIYLAGAEEIRVVRPGPMPRIQSRDNSWFRDSKKFFNGFSQFLGAQKSSLIEKNFLLEEFKPRSRTSFQKEKIEKGDKIYSTLGLEPNLSKTQLENLDAQVKVVDSPLNFLLSHPMRGDAYSSFEKFRYRLESFSGLADRALGIIQFRSPSPGPLVVEPLGPLLFSAPLFKWENEFQDWAKSETSGDFCLIAFGFWDTRNPIHLRRISGFYSAWKKNEETWGKDVFQLEAEQNPAATLASLWSGLDPSVGWEVRNWSENFEFFDYSSWRCRYQRVYFAKVPKNAFEKIKLASKDFNIPLFHLGSPSPKTPEEILFFDDNESKSSPFARVSRVELKKLFEAKHQFKVLEWMYPEMKSPTYGFDRVALFPDEYLKKVSVRDPVEPVWAKEVRQIASGENFRSLLLRGEGPSPVPGLRWANSTGVFAEAVGTREGWMGVEPRSAGVAAVESALRWLVSLGAHPSGGIAYLWTSNPDDFESTEEQSRSAQMMALLGAADALKSFGFKLVQWNLSGASFPQMKNEIFVGLRSKLPQNFATTFPGFRMVGEALFVVGPKPAFMDAGSRILSHVSRVISNHVSKVFYEDQLEICRILHEQILKGTITCIRPVSEAGLLATIGEMSLWGGMGAQIRPTLSTIDLFSGAPGRFIVGVLPQEAKKFEALIKSEWIAPVGTSGGEKIFGLGLDSFRKFRLGEEANE